MRILEIIPTLDRAGAEKQLCLLAAGLPRPEFEVHVCALSRGGPLAADLAASGIPLVVIGKRWKLDPQAFWRLKGHIAGLRPDLIHSWMFAANTYGFAAARACGVKNLIIGQRCVDPWKSRLQLAADRALARRSRAVVANSEGVREFYVRHGAPPERVRVIPNGVAIPQPPATTRRQLLAELGLPQQSRLIGLVGRLWPQKRVKDAIWAADLLKVIRSDVHLLVIGDGPQRDRLLHFRDQCRIGDKVHFLGVRGDVPRLLPHFDVLWSTSGYEGQSNVILEAMAAGVPVVATDIPGTRELVSSGTTGYLVPVGDRAGFAKYADRLLNDAALAARVSAAARDRAEREFSIERMIERHVELYRELTTAIPG
jgi:glycosyltransferase involved in cell wall biosynthesis